MQNNTIIKDKLGRDVRVGDWVSYSHYKNVCVGVVVDFTKSRNPKALEYKGIVREDGLHSFERTPTAIVHSSVIKIEPIIDFENYLNEQR